MYTYIYVERENNKIKINKITQGPILSEFLGFCALKCGRMTFLRH